jgi:hypothetical protein
MTRAAVGLCVLAVALLALSFVDWRALAATAAPTPSPPLAPPSPPPAEYGRSLFLIKGCPTCHRHDGLGLSRAGFDEANEPEFTGMFGAPDLTNYQPDPAFVREWLRDPAAVRPGTEMPDLDLTDDEIEALLAFLQTNGPP